MTITKEKHNAIQDEAQSMINEHGGISYLDLAYKSNKPAWRKIQLGYEGWLMLHYGITAPTAKRHVAKAAWRLRHPDKQIEDNWGGDRHSGNN